MKIGLYPRLAFEGLGKNSQLSRPYLLTCVGMVAMHYILAFLSSPAVLEKLPQGSDTVGLMMALGCVVVLLFSLIFLFYTYSFLNRRRAREFGLYNVLGMGKGSLSRIVLWESAITASVSLIGGLLLGAALSKLAELGLVNLMHGEIDYRIHLDFKAVFRTVACYVPVFALNALAAVLRTRCKSAVSLLKAENAGEKPPKGNWALALLGALLLCAAYWMALSIQSPLEALMWFFVAVLMVILASYLLLIAGSVWLCRRLQANKRYYYRADHFVSVSSMAYRMKRNGAGLASICIIATMVLVMLSTTTCLMAGIEDAVLSSAPREEMIHLWSNDLSLIHSLEPERISSAVSGYAKEHGIPLKNPLCYRYLYATGIQNGDALQCGGEAEPGDLREVFLVSAADYSALTGKAAALDSGEAMLLTNRCEYRWESLTLGTGNKFCSFRVASVQKGALRDDSGIAIPSLTLVVPDLEAVAHSLRLGETTQSGGFTLRLKFGFDPGLGDRRNAVEAELSTLLKPLIEAERGRSGLSFSDRASEEADYRAICGGLFFIGVVLSIVFLLAAVLIIYYKQVSEGYEDAGRFGIMQKLGMTRPEIRRSIASQLLIVFMLPLAFAGLHLAFAFPMIRKMLLLLGLTNIGLFIRTTLLSFAVFAAFYWVVYRMTSGVYYRIVSGSESAVQ